MKRIFALILSSAMALSFIACGEADSGSPIAAAESPATNEETETTAEETTQGLPMPELPEKNYNGETFTILTRGRYSGSFEEMFLCAEELNGEIVNDAVFNRNAEVEDKFNLKLVITEDPDAAKTAEKLVLAADNTVDVVDTQAMSLAAMSKKNVLVNLLNIDYLNLDADYWSSLVKKDLQIDGKLYMMPSDISMNRLEYAFFLYFNKEIIKDYNLEDPYKHLDENKWTLDRFLDYITAVSADLNGDGIYDDKDQYSILYENFDIHYILIGSGVNYTAPDDEKGLVLTAYTDKTDSIIERCRTAFSGNNVASYMGISEGVDTSGYDNRWEWARTLFTNRQYLFMDLGMFELENLRDMADDFGLLPMPKYDETQEDYYHRVNPEGCIFAVPMCCPDLERVGVVLEYASYISNRDLLPAYYDTTIKQKKIRDDKAVSHRLEREFKETVCWIDEDMDPYTGRWIARDELLRDNWNVLLILR